jgi:uncharacterized membrane-anchored protein YhcB (DUF1043 family)
MRAFVTFLLGIIVGAVGMLFLPELAPRREQLNEEMKKQMEILQGQVRELADQLKKKPDDNQSKPPSASPSPTAQ